jgi:hypothetical protein
MATASGDHYVSDEVRQSRSQHGRQTLIYGTAVRTGGETHGRALGALGVYFDWEAQGASIVSNEIALAEAERQRTTVMLLDGNLRVIACTAPELLFKPCALETHGLARGSYTNAEGELVAFARTHGYQEYDGRGWYGVIVQRL